MIAGFFDRGRGIARRDTAMVFACLLLTTVCAGPPPTTTWVKAGADDPTTQHEIDDCRAQANVALARQQGINQDISATLGRNWQMSQTTGLQDQNMRGQAAADAGQAFNSCMRAKGFKKQG
jgi:hypothetical protein